MLYRAEIQTPYAGTGIEGDPFRAAVADSFALQGWQDVTGHDPAGISAMPDYVIHCILEEDVLNAIKGDGAYQILSSEPVPEEEGIA